MAKTKTIDALDLIAKRTERGNGSLYRLPKLQGAVMDVVSAPVLDRATASATAIISTPTPDRSEDVVFPRGVSLTNYKKNPVVYYDHGFAHIQTPIAKSEDGDGKLTVKVRDSGIEATSFFSQSMWEAMQIYALIDEGIIRCASIHIIPTVAKVRSETDRYRSGLQIEEAELLEWSWVGIPDNPEAVRKVLDRGKLADRNIHVALAKSLARYAAQPKGLVQGMSIEKAFPPKDDEDGEDKEKKPKPEASDEGDAPPEASDKGDVGESGDAPVEENAEGMPEGDAPPEQQNQNQQPQDFSQKPGAQLATGIHGAVAGFAQELSSQLARQENDAIQQMANDVVDLLNQIQLRCSDGFKQAYGQDIPAAGGMGQQQQQPPPQANPQDEQMFKHFVSALLKDAKTETPKKTEYSLRAIAKGLSDASMKRQLSPEEIHRLGHWSKRLMELTDEAKAEVAKPVTQPNSNPENDAFYKAAAELLNEQKRVSEKLQSLRIA